MPDREIPRGHILAFDFGLRRIGVAVGQTQTRTASALQTVAHGQNPDWAAISKLVEEWSPNHFVVGLPLADDGTETEMSRKARAFGTQLSGRFGPTVAYFDERLSSIEAEKSFAEARAQGKARRKDAERVDAVAARIILENWLQSLPGHDSPTEPGKPSD
jgi:putative Holliday junction resolvase